VRTKREQIETIAVFLLFVGGSLSASLSLDVALLPDSLSAMPRLLAGLSLIASR